jgi:hypothetical protein
MNHPLAFISNSARKPVFFVLLVWTLFLFAVSQIINSPLVTSAAPSGIISFELAHTLTRAQAIIASWDARLQLFAAFGLGIDYLFMPSYAFTIALACLLAAGRNEGWFVILGAWLGRGVILAALLDVVENIGQLKSLLGNVNSTWSEISFWCAILKFTLILLGIAYALIGWILIIKKSQNRDDPTG